jgi:cytochrome c
VRNRQLTAGVAGAILLVSATASATPNASEGESIFKQTCGLCHSPEPGQNLVGPSLAGVVGRKAGQVPDYPYSQANLSSGLTWDKATLDTYLTNPRGLVPGTKMSFPGLKDPNARASVIAFLETLR